MKHTIKSRNLYPVFWAFLAFVSSNAFQACTNEGVCEASAPVRQKLEHPPLFKHVFAACFLGADTTASHPTISCNGSFYTVLNDESVLHVQGVYDLPMFECSKLQVGSGSEAVSAQLYRFHRGEASLTNLCTDIILINAPLAIDTLEPATGTMRIVVDGAMDLAIVGGKDSITVPGPVTIWVDSLVFPGTETSQPVTVRNILLWKVNDSGVAG